MTLRDLPIGKTATILSVGGEGALRQHFLDMGLIPKGEVTMVKYAPMGDPMELRIHSYELTLRLADAEKIEITDVRDGVLPRPQNPDLSTIEQSKPHPGLGEGGNTILKQRKIHCRIQSCLPLPLQETRTAARPHCLTSLPVPTSM